MFKATNLKLDEGISELWEGRKKDPVFTAKGNG
jgi:hypothetical protein